MRKLYKEERKDYEFLLQFIDLEKIELKLEKPPEGFNDYRLDEDGRLEV